MSQEKVDRYKEQKANRKQIMAREKREKFLVKLCAGLVALALVCWLGYSIYDRANQPDTSDVAITTTAIDDYVNTLQQQLQNEKEKPCADGHAVFA